MRARLAGARFAASLLVASLASLPACSRKSGDQPAPAAAAVPYGTAMADVARRFELLGRAVAGGRFELADYQLGELGEVFEGVLPHAEIPREGHPEVLPARVADFVKTTLPDLQRALASHDPAAATAAFARTATACNACHQASGHGFLEVPLVPGRPVPVTDPVAPAP